MFDETPKKLHGPPGDSGTYYHGYIGQHAVVMVSLSAGNYGVENAAHVVTDLRRSYPNVKFGLFVGIAGGVPGIKADVRLGDVVVSQPMQSHGGVVFYDKEKLQAGDKFVRKGHLNRPPTEAMSAITTLRTRAELEDSTNSAAYLAAMFERNPKMIDAYSRPELEPDELTSEGHVFHRKLRPNKQVPVVHYGLIASGSKVIASAAERNRLCDIDPDILCFEMEASGIMNLLPSVVVRGICDYADDHKHDGWQKAAAAAAACFAKELLEEVSPHINQSTTQAGAQDERHYGSAGQWRFRAITNNVGDNNSFGKNSSVNSLYLGDANIRNH